MKNKELQDCITDLHGKKKDRPQITLIHTDLKLRKRWKSLDGIKKIKAVGSRFLMEITQH